METPRPSYGATCGSATRGNRDGRRGVRGCGSSDPQRFPTGVPNVTVNLIEPGTLYGNRINQLDLRIAKLFRFGGTKTFVGVDLYNALNDRRDSDLQQRVRTRRHVAAAADRRDGAHDPLQRGVHVLGR